MKILYHHRTQMEDAQGIHIHEIVKAFRELGHEVDMVALVNREVTGLGKEDRNSWRWLRNYTPNWCYELMSLAYNVYGYRQLCKAIKSKRPDLMYERYSLNTFCGIWASKRFGIPLILEVNAPLYHEQKQLGNLAFKRLTLFSERWICTNSKKTIVVSKVMKEFLKQEGVPEERMVVMPNGIDPGKFNPSISGNTIRERYGLDGKIVVGFVGFFRKWHGLEMLLEAVYEGKLSERGMKLLLVGEGPAYDDLYRFAKEKGLLSGVLFTGSIRHQEVPAYVAAMDIAVQPSATEYACPIKIIEYMGMGKCIVAPKQPNIEELLEDRVTGFLFQDKAELRSLLFDLILDSKKRGKTGENAYKSLLTRGFLWERNARTILTLLTQREN